MLPRPPRFPIHVGLPERRSCAPQRNLPWRASDTSQPIKPLQPTKLLAREWHSSANQIFKIKKNFLVHARRKHAKFSMNGNFLYIVRITTRLNDGRKISHVTNRVSMIRGESHDTTGVALVWHIRTNPKLLLTNLNLTYPMIYIPMWRLCLYVHIVLTLHTEVWKSLYDTYTKCMYVIMNRFPTYQPHDNRTKGTILMSSLT